MAEPVAPVADEAERKRIIAARNRALGLALGFVVLLFFAITVVKVRA